MNIEHQNHGNFGAPGSSKVIKTSGSVSRFSEFMDYVHSARTLYLISAILQVGLGLGVVFAAVTGFIQPLWFSTLLSMFASLTCMVGVYLLYSVISAGHGPEQLIRDAMRRIMNAQN